MMNLDAGSIRDVDSRAVVNIDQARRMLAAVGQQGERGERMVGFFGCLDYALPDHGWGELILTSAEPRSGTWWTDSGSGRERRELKHRPRGETRPVPIRPELAGSSGVS
jgi:hypothetical protein